MGPEVHVAQGDGCALAIDALWPWARAPQPRPAARVVDDDLLPERVPLPARCAPPCPTPLAGSAALAAVDRAGLAHRKSTLPGAGDGNVRLPRGARLAPANHYPGTAPPGGWPGPGTRRAGTRAPAPIAALSRRRKATLTLTLLASIRVTPPRAGEEAQIDDPPASFRPADVARPGSDSRKRNLTAVARLFPKSLLIAAWGSPSG